MLRPPSVEGPAGAGGVPVRLLAVLLGHWRVHVSQLSADGAHQERPSGQRRGSAADAAHHQGKTMREQTMKMRSSQKCCIIRRLFFS